MGAANTIHNYNNCLVFVGKLLILLVGVDFGGNGKWKILCIRIWGPRHRNYYRIARNSDIHKQLDLVADGQVFPPLLF